MNTADKQKQNEKEDDMKEFLKAYEMKSMNYQQIITIYQKYALTP